MHNDRSDGLLCCFPPAMNAPWHAYAAATISPMKLQIGKGCQGELQVARDALGDALKVVAICCYCY